MAPLRLYKLRYMGVVKEILEMYTLYKFKICEPIEEKNTETRSSVLAKVVSLVPQQGQLE